MTKTAMIDLNILHATSLFVSTEETRYYLRGVCVEIEASSIAYTATDGHRMFAYRKLQVGQPDNSLLGTFIIPTAECNPFKRGKRDAVEALLSEENGSALRFDYNGQAKSFKPIDGVYPDWRRIASSAEPQAGGSILSFDWNYVASFQKAGAMLGIGMPTLMPCGQGPAVMQFGECPDALGMVMPRRAAETRTAAIPEWVARRAA